MSNQKKTYISNDSINKINTASFFNKFTFSLMILVIFFLFAGISYISYLWINNLNNQKNDSENFASLKDEIEKSISENYLSKIMNLINSNEVLSKNNSKSISKISKIFDELFIQMNNNNQNLTNSFSKLEIQLKQIEAKLASITSIKKEERKLTENHKLKLSDNDININELLYSAIMNEKEWSREIIYFLENAQQDLIDKFSYELDLLERYSSNPPPSVNDLKNSFKVIIPDILNHLPLKGDGWLDKLQNWAFKSIQLRRTNGSSKNQPQDKISNIENYLSDKKLQQAFDLFSDLPIKMKTAGKKWMEQLSLKINIQNAAKAILKAPEVLRQ